MGTEEIDNGESIMEFNTTRRSTRRCHIRKGTFKGILSTKLILGVFKRCFRVKDYFKDLLTFSCISDVLCASQNATVATSFSIGISIEQSRPSSNATKGRACIGPLEIGARTSPNLGLFVIIFNLLLRFVCVCGVCCMYKINFNNN